MAVNPIGLIIISIIISGLRLFPEFTQSAHLSQTLAGFVWDFMRFLTGVIYQPYKVQEIMNHQIKQIAARLRGLRDALELSTEEFA